MLLLPKTTLLLVRGVFFISLLINTTIVTSLLLWSPHALPNNYYIECASTKSTCSLSQERSFSLIIILLETIVHIMKLLILIFYEVNVNNHNLITLSKGRIWIKYTISIIQCQPLIYYPICFCIKDRFYSFNALSSSSSRKFFSIIHSSLTRV